MMWREKPREELDYHWDKETSTDLRKIDVFSIVFPFKDMINLSIYSGLTFPFRVLSFLGHSPDPESSIALIIIHSVLYHIK